MKYLIGHVLFLVLSIDTIDCGRRHFGGVSSGQGPPLISDYSNSTRIDHDGEAIIVIPVPVIDRKANERKKNQNAIRTSDWNQKQWEENGKLITGEKVFKDDKRYYPCPAVLVTSHWDKVSHHLNNEIYPYLPLGVNVTLICIKEKDYGWFDAEYWQRDYLGVKWTIGFWIIVLVALTLFCAYKNSY